MRDLDPNGIRKDNRISKDIKVNITTKAYCKVCTSKTELTKLCNECKKELEKEIPKWDLINQIIDSHYA